MSRRKALSVLTVVAALCALCRAEDTPKIEPKAEEVLRQMSAALAGAKNLTLESHTTMEQVLPPDIKVEIARNQQVAVSRPNRAASVAHGDLENVHMVYDGTRVVIHNLDKNAWAQVDAPDTIDATLDMLAEKHGLAMPLADLVFSDPYRAMAENVTSGHYVGDGYVLDIKCHHLLFTQDAVDWQIWVEQGATPMPRKIVITYKQMPNLPRFTALLSNWDLNAAIPEETFAFEPPAGAEQVELAAPTTAPATAPNEED